MIDGCRMNASPGWCDATGRAIGYVSMMMKIQNWFLVAVAGLALSSCASHKESMVTKTDQTEKRVHTQEELKKTGESQTGPALEKTDAAVQTSRRP